MRTESQPFEKVWLTSDLRAAIHFVEDFLINMPYIIVEGDNKDAIVALIRGIPPFFELQELIGRFRNASSAPERSRGTQRIGISAPADFDEHIFDQFARAFADPEPEVRKAALLAVVHVGWPEFQDVLTRLGDVDRDPSVRDAAIRMRSSLTKHNWNDDVGNCVRQ